MAETCAECKKKLEKDEGFVSTTGILVCGKECMDAYLKKLPNNGKAALTSYSRVTGYLTPVNSWNAGKLKEFNDRKRYALGE